MPSYSEQYTVGFLILDKNDPTQILQRSEQPILIPDMAWEIGMLCTHALSSYTSESTCTVIQTYALCIQ